MKNKLKIVELNSTPMQHPLTNKESSSLFRQKEKEAKFERLWLLNPEQFNPLRNCMQKERLNRSMTLLTKNKEIKNQQIIDIGCGIGVFTRLMRDMGGEIEAIDIAENALKILRKEDMKDIKARQAGMPSTNLSDHAYDVVVCMEVIAEVSSQDYRLFFAELARLAKPDGLVLCSSPIDIRSLGGMQRLRELAQTEFDIIDSSASYHALHIYMKDFLEIPQKYVKGSKDPFYRNESLAHLKGTRNWWFWLQTTFCFGWIWLLLEILSRFPLNLLKGNHQLLLWLENVSEFIWGQNGISHYIFLARRRPLERINQNEIPLEKLRKREVWE
ncbi:MAG: class I SAM-dependent methyltransferase [Candidatus Protochlamydia sp.]|nr:class I SAM-dependent methyltransferase [Candidatus Protochlamydia sp.]